MDRLDDARSVGASDEDRRRHEDALFAQILDPAEDARIGRVLRALGL